MAPKNNNYETYLHANFEDKPWKLNISINMYKFTQP